MADGGLLLIYRGMTTDQLLDLQAQFTEQWIALGPYSAQTVGDKSFTKDPRGLQSQLEAIQFVLNERGAGGTPGYVRLFVYDFSLGTTNAQPAGTNDQLSY
jgi:hypothetical protein